MKRCERIIIEVESYLKTLGYSKLTYSEVVQNLKEFSEFLSVQHGKLSFNKVSLEQLGEYIAYLKTRKNKRREGGISAIRINSQINSLKKLSEFLWHNYEVFLPAMGLKQFKVGHREKEHLTVNEVKKLFEVTHSTDRMGFRDRAMLAVYYGCGLRRKEGECLKLKDVDFKTGLLFVRNGKGNRERYVPMSEVVQHHIKQYITNGRPLFIRKSKREESLFVNERGDEIQGQSLFNRLTVLKEQAGITKNIGLHTLRHSIATHLLEKNMELEDISMFLGHSSLESTQIYTHITEAEEFKSEYETQQKI